MNVVLVEDDETLSETMIKVLTHLGHTPFPAKNEEEATKIIGIVKPDLVLLDLLLNGVLSTPFINVAKALMKEKPPRIVISSALNNAKNIAEQNQVEFLAKPFDIKALEELLNKSIKN